MCKVSWCLNELERLRGMKSYVHDPEVVGSNTGHIELDM